MRKVRIIIRLSRYQRDKLLGEQYRSESNGGESFKDWYNRTKNDSRKKSKYKVI